MGNASSKLAEVRNVFRILTGKPTGKRPQIRPKFKWEDNIRTDLKERCVNTRNWIDSAQNRNY